MDIGANPSAEGGDEDEGVDDQAQKVVDIVDTFRLQVSDEFISLFVLVISCGGYCIIFLLGLQEQPAFDKKQFVTFMKRYIKLLTPKLEGEKQEEFKKNIEAATKFLLSKLSDLQLYIHLYFLLTCAFKVFFGI